MTARDDRIRLLQLQLNDVAKQLAALQRLDRLGSTDVGGTLHAATAKTTPVDADTMPLIDSAASNVLKKVTWANIKATLKTYFDTLYVALSGAQTITGLKTFSAGLTFGGSTFGAYTQGTWPSVGVSASSPGTMAATYTINTSRYTRIGDVVFYTCFIRLNTYSAGSGSGELWITSLPFTASSSNVNIHAASVMTNGVDWPAIPISVQAEVPASTNIIRLYSIQDNGARSYVSPSSLAAGDDISVTGFYFV